MPIPEIVLSTGLFVISTLVAVYLVRYSNQQLTRCLTGLEDKHNELVDLNGKLAKEIFQSDKRLRDHLETVKSSGRKK